MNSGTDRLRRITAALALAGLLSLTAACGAADDTDTSNNSAAAPAAAGATRAAAPKKAGGKVPTDAMKDGCADVRKMLVAASGGDEAAAQSFLNGGLNKLNDVADKAASKDEQLSSDAGAMASVLSRLPVKPVFQSGVADTYTVDCVARHGAEALPS